MGLAVSCPRCGGAVRPPGLTHSQWLCDTCGVVSPLHTARRVNAEALGAVVGKAADAGIPMWCPWPMPVGWTVSGFAWVGDDRDGVVATALACTGPAPLSSGPADLALVAEEPGTGLGAYIAGFDGPDPGQQLAGAVAGQEPHAKVKAAGRPTPLWSVAVPEDRSAYAGEAKGRWLFAISWPAQAGYLLAETSVLHDLCEWLPPELVFGAPTARLPSSH